VKQGSALAQTFWPALKHDQNEFELLIAIRSIRDDIFLTDRLITFMKNTKTLIITALFTAGLISGIGCREKGPLEKAGAKIDKAAEKTADKAKEGAEAVGDAAEKAGDKIKDATK
jgi:hypothetical protein